ncbi:5082_t:CDS:1 [Dentiscutata erythropus]|uniref:5082_t:CDS:1 n=1 Tax=Dentiscutata erythropus TaxID=1348616 RepID=A0A9N9IPP3_9GLOM|nr:5082_t:CDS:1 [Dentiscutata erythropus]
MSNVYTLKDLNKRRHRLGSVYKQELEKKIRSVTEFNSEINDLSEKLVDKYNEREKEYQRSYSDIGNKISQLNVSSTKVRSQLISEQKFHSESQCELEAKYTAEIKSLKSSIKSLKGEATLAQKALSLDKVKIISLEAKIDELEAKIKHLELKRVGSSPPISQGLNIVEGLLEKPAQINLSEIDSLRLELGQVKEDLNLKKHEIECMEKGIEATDIIYKRELDRLYSAQSNLMEENSHLRVLVLKKDNEVVPERSAEYEPPLTNDTKERVSKQVPKELQLSALNPLPSQIFSVSGAEAEPLLTTVPIIPDSSMMPMIIYSILTLLLIAII